MTCKYHALIYLASLLTGSLRAALAELAAQRFSERNVYSAPSLRSGFSHGHESGLKMACRKNWAASAIRHPSF